MTEQIPHKLVNRHPTVKLDSIFLYAVIIGPVVENHGWGSSHYPFKTPPDNPQNVVTSNWAGFVCEFELGVDGCLTLISYHYPCAGREPTPVHELLEGDFFLVLKSDFHGSRLYVPFQNGRIIEARERWLHEEKLEIQRFHTAEVQAEIDALRAEGLKQWAIRFEEEFQAASNRTEKMIACLRGLHANFAQYREPLRELVDSLTVNSPLTLNEADQLIGQVRRSEVREGSEIRERVAEILLYQTDTLGSQMIRSRHWKETGWFFRRTFTQDTKQPALLWEKRLDRLRFLHEYLSMTAAGKEAKKLLDLDIRSKQLEVEVHVASMNLPSNEQLCKKLAELLTGFSGEIHRFRDRTRQRLSGVYDDYPIGVEIYIEPWSDAWPTSRKLRSAVGQGVWGVCFRWGVRPVDCRAGLLCSAGFAELTGGCLYDSEEDRCIPASEAVAWARQILA